MCSFTVSPFDFSCIFAIIKGCTVALSCVSLTLTASEREEQRSDLGVKSARSCFYYR